MSNLSQFGSGIKSIQRGTITVNIAGSTALYSNTATITAVDPTKSTIELLGGTLPTSQYSTCHYRIDLTNGTTVTAYAGNNNGAVGNFVIGYQVVEYY